MRKWFYDIDNRAGQETGYLFEPIIANAVGGAPIPSSKSPIKRHKDTKKGRQVDCILNKKAYEIKLRVTIAASGQGRWREELDFPIDCRKSGFSPVLVVLDPTPNPKLQELSQAFIAQKGKVFTGEAAWKHLDSLAGRTMATFLDRYVRLPLQRLLKESPDRTQLPDLTVRMQNDQIHLLIEDERLVIERTIAADATDDDVSADPIPDDASDALPD